MPRPATVPISRTKWAILFSEQGGCCAGCFKPLGEDVHVDHVNPLARGGEDRFENLQLLHAACNLAKGDMTAAAWFDRQRRGFMLRIGQIRRRQVLLTIDPEIVLKLRAAAKRARMPVSALVEEGARRVLGIISGDRRSAVPTAPVVPPQVAAGQHGDLFGGGPQLTDVRCPPQG